MSEIKIQVWDGKEMLTMSSALALDLVGFSGEDLEIYSGDVYVRRFTGLKDRNGNPVYEGDILKLDSHYYGDSFIREKNRQVEFSYGGFNAGSSEAYEWDNIGVEIIGNIYESPELLDANQSIINQD